VHALRRASVAAFALLALTTPARSEECGRPDLLHAFPPDGATVPTDAIFSAYYASTAEYLGEDVLFEHLGSGEPAEPIAAEFESNTGLVVARAPDLLVPGDDYEITWPKLRGIGTASKGDGRKVTFTVGDGPDLEFPSFGGLLSIEWDVSRNRDDCTDSQEERFAFDLEPGTAGDDFGTESLALSVFQTRGPNVPRRGNPVPILVTALPAAGKTVRVSRAIRDGTGDVCFSATVKDLKGNPSESGDEVCVTTTAPPFFYGCSVGGSPHGDRGFALVAGLGALFLLRSRRHRPPL